MSSGLSMSMRVAFLLMISIGGGFGIGHLPRQYQLRAVLAAICLIEEPQTEKVAEIPRIYSRAK